MVPEPNEGSVVDFVMLTDRAEVHDGKLYIMGGAWDRLFLTDFDNPYSISFAIAVSVPYAQTEREQRFEMQLMRNGEQVRGWQLGFRAGRGSFVRRPATAGVPRADGCDTAARGRNVRPHCLRRWDPAIYN